MQFKFVFSNVFAIYLFLSSNSFTFIHINFDIVQRGGIRLLFTFFYQVLQEQH